MPTVTYLLGVVGAVLVVALVGEMLRRRFLRGKYAVLWLGLGSVIALFAAVPEVLRRLAALLGVQVPANLLFFGAIIVLLLLAMQLSYESGRLEEETRTLAEEIGLLRLELDELRDSVGQPPPST